MEAIVRRDNSSKTYGFYGALVAPAAQTTAGKATISRFKNSLPQECSGRT